MDIDRAHISESPCDLRAVTLTYGYTAHLPGTSFEDARARTVEALKSQGFGVLTEIDVQDT